MPKEKIPLPKSFRSRCPDLLIKALACVPHLEEDSKLEFYAHGISPYASEGEYDKYEESIKRLNILPGTKLHLRFNYPGALRLDGRNLEIGGSYSCPQGSINLFLTGGKVHVVNLSPGIWCHSVHSIDDATLYLEAPAFAATVKQSLLDKGYILERAELRPDPQRDRSSNEGLGVNISCITGGAYEMRFMGSGDYFYVYKNDGPKFEMARQTVKWYEHIRNIYGQKTMCSDNQKAS